MVLIYRKRWCLDMIKAVIFDLNGVFLKSEYLHKRMENSFGIKKDEFLPILKNIMGEVRKPNAPPVFTLWEPHIKRWKIILNEEEFLQFWFSGEHVVKEMIQLAKELQGKNIKVFILSNNFKERTTYYRKKFPELFTCVDKAYFSWETGILKDGKKAYQNILNENNLTPEDCIYFDDSQEKVDLAKSAGIDSFQFESVEKTKEIIHAHFN